MSSLPIRLLGRMLLGLAFAPLAVFGQSVDLTALTLTQAEELLQMRNRELQVARGLRLEAGDLARGGVARLRVDALRAQNDARSAEADQRRAQLALAYMIGAEGRAIGIRAVDPWPSIYAGRPGGPVDELIEGRPDVRAAKNRLEAAQNGRDLARSLRTRDVTVGAQYEHYPIGTAPANTFGTGNS